VSLRVVVSINGAQAVLVLGASCCTGVEGSQVTNTHLGNCCVQLFECPPDKKSTCLNYFHPFCCRSIERQRVAGCARNRQGLRLGNGHTFGTASETVRARSFAANESVWSPLGKP
jgi:hypothetical protein